MWTICCKCRENEELKDILRTFPPRTQANPGMHQVTCSGLGVVCTPTALVSGAWTSVAILWRDEGLEGVGPLRCHEVLHVPPSRRFWGNCQRTCTLKQVKLTAESLPAACLPHTPNTQPHQAARPHSGQLNADANPWTTRSAGSTNHPALGISPWSGKNRETAHPPLIFHIPCAHLSLLHLYLCLYIAIINVFLSYDIQFLK